ncbi:MAG: META domain-containing protein [Bacteroidales bacterium]
MRLIFISLLIVLVGACRSKKEVVVVSPKPLTDVSTNKLDKVWKLVSMDGSKVAQSDFSSDIPSMTVDSKNNYFDGVDGCNMFEGEMHVQEDHIKFVPSSKTKNTCKKNSFSNKFGHLLTKDKLRYKIVETNLILYSGGIEVLRFVEF